MDFSLKTAQQRAQLNPDNPEALWAYIRHLERSGNSESGEPEPLFAILTDGETIGSPCSYSDGTPIPYQPDDDKITLFGRWMDDYSSDEPAQNFDGITQAWIITQSTVDAGNALQKDADYGRDSIQDAVTSAMLSLYKNMAVQTIQFPDYGGVEDYGFVDDELESKIYAAYEAYRTSKDRGRVRVSLHYMSEDMDAILGEGLVAGTPHKLLVCDIRGGHPFEAVLHKMLHPNYTTGCYHLLCQHCSREVPEGHQLPDFRCSRKPGIQYASQSHHNLDEHVILEIDDEPIADRAAFDTWLIKNRATT